MKAEPNDRTENISANRRGELTPEQEAMLLFALEARRLSALLGLLIALFGVCLFGTFLGWALQDRSGWETAAELGLIIALSLYAAWASQRALRRLQRSRHELQRHHLKCADGEVFWNGQRYDVRLAQAERLLLDTPLIPGRYRFYYVPFSGMALSVERLSTTAQMREDLLGSLMRALRFDADELSSNRTGRLAQKQKDRLFRSVLLMTAVRLAALLAGGAALVYFCISLQIGRGVDYGWTAVLASGPSLILWAAALADFLRDRADLLDGRVVAVQGVGVRPAESREWEISCVRFRVPRKIGAAMIPGIRYRAYYLPRSRHLLSVEPLALKG